MTIVFLAICGASAVTPMDKVITLLKDLGSKVDAQGRKEAIQYGKYSCFCKDEATAKRAQIAKSAARIVVIESDIALLQSKEVKDLGTIKTLNTGITTSETEVVKETGSRKDNRAIYLAAAKDLNEAIASVKAALVRLKEPKADMTGADLNLAQLKSVAVTAKLGHSSANLKEALSLMQTAASATGVVQQKPAGYKYQSNEIIATIEDILTTFNENKRELDLNEIGSKDTSGKKVLAENNEVTFKSAERSDTEIVLSGEYSTEAGAQLVLAKEKAFKLADTNFLNTLTSDCEAKANAWDQRSTARADEITALAEATTTLEQGAKAAYSANEKLALMTVSAVTPKTLSFLQIAKGANTQADAGKKILSILDNAALNSKSPLLSALAFKVSLKIDHFSNVRKLINDLVTKLEADASAEATTKSFCDKEMKEAVDARDNAQDAIEENNGKVARQTAEADKQAAYFKEATQDMAASNKEKMEGTKFRAEEKADNQQALEEAKKGSAAVKVALGVLKEFYDNAAKSTQVQPNSKLMQVQQKYTPPNADRSGKAFKDVAPEAFSGEYKGSQAESKGVIGILEVIEKDFDRSVETITQEESGAETAWGTAESDIDKKVGGLVTAKSDAKKAKDDAEGDIVSAKSDLFDHTTLKAGAKKQLEKLSSMCVDGEETYAERVAKREKEMASLKEATALLDDLMAK